MDKEKELEAREKSLEERERRVSEKEKQLGAFSSAIKARKEEWYDRVPLNTRQLTVIIRILYVLLGIVGILIVLEAAGIFKL